MCLFKKHNLKILFPLFSRNSSDKNDAHASCFLNGGGKAEALKFMITVGT